MYQLQPALISGFFAINPTAVVHTSMIGNGQATQKGGGKKRKSTLEILSGPRKTARATLPQLV
jgi:hypothetical protein